MVKKLALSLLALFVFLAPASADKPQERNPLREYVLRAKGRYAYGCYIRGKKVGWEIDEIALGRRDGKEVAVYTNESFFSAALMGVKTVKEDRTTVCYSLEGEG